MGLSEVTLAGIKLKNPFMPASGTAAYGQELARIMDLNDLGALVIKSTTLEPRVGHPWPTTAETTGGWLNAVGLKNPGIKNVITEKLPWLAQNYPDLPIIGSIAGESFDEYVEVARQMDSAKNVVAIEVNISCPNVERGGMEFGTDAQTVQSLTEAIKAVTTKPIFMKLTPNVTNVIEIALAAEKGGADGLTMINTMLGMEIDLNTRKPHLSNSMGGLSGKAIHPIAVRMIHQVRQQSNLPIIGAGGVFTADDALELMLAGANAIQIGSASYGNPHAISDINTNFPKQMLKYGFESMDALSK